MNPYQLEPMDFIYLIFEYERIAVRRDQILAMKARDLGREFGESDRFKATIYHTIPGLKSPMQTDTPYGELLAFIAKIPVPQH